MPKQHFVTTLAYYALLLYLCKAKACFAGLDRKT